MARRQNPDDHDDVAREIRAHLELEAEEHVAEGLSEEEARFAARRAFGNVTRTQEDVRAVRAWRWMDDAARDVRYALRTLRRSPGLAAVAMLTLALGIGATTALFTVADPLLTRPLPVARPGELVLFRTLGSSGWTDADARVPMTLVDRIREGSASFADVLVWHYSRASHQMRLWREDESGLGHLVVATSVDASFFRTLGVGAAIGRVFADGDDGPDAPGLVVLSDGFWRRFYGADPAVVGRHVRLTDGASDPYLPDGAVATIVGVAPRGFAGIDLDLASDMWVVALRADGLAGTPVGIARQMLGTLPTAVNPLPSSGGATRAMARLRPGVSLEHAQAEVDGLAAGAFDQLVGQYANVAATSSPRVRVEPAATGYSQVRERFRLPIVILAVAVGLVLMVACVNVAALLLARSTARHREIALRLSLGSGRLAIVRLMLAESAVLAVGGGALALLVAHWGRLAVTSVLPEDLIAFATGGLDVRVLGFTAVVAVVSVVLSALAPALWMSRLDRNRLLKGPEGGGSAARLHKTVLAAQVAFAVVLLVGAGLFLRTLHHLRAVPTGFDQDEVVQLTIDARTLRVGSGEGPPAAALVERLEGLPGVVSVTSYPVLGGGLGRLLPGGERRTIAAVAGGDADALSVSWMLVGPRFFETMGITVLAGRAFGPQDGPRDAVVVISEGLARRLFGSVAAAIDLPLHGAAPPGWADPIVVGVVEHVPHLSLRDPDHWAVYQPFSPFGARSPTERLVLRTDGDAAGMIPAIREALAEFGHEFAIADARTLRTITEASIARERLAANLVATFGVLAIVLLTIGVYGVVAYTVAQRTKEIGVRMALGARAGTIVAMVVRQVLLVVAAGVALGIVAAVGASQLVAHLLFGVTSADPTTLLAAAAVLGVAAGVASCLPALRAARRIDPIAALRE